MNISLLYPNYDLFELKEKVEQGLVDTTFRNFDFTGGIVVKSGQRLNKGLSLYFGSRQSPFYLNFYQKDYELAKKKKYLLKWLVRNMVLKIVMKSV